MPSYENYLDFLVLGNSGKINISVSHWRTLVFDYAVQYLNVGSVVNID